MNTKSLAGQPAPIESLTNIPRLVSAYYTYKPDPENPAHRVAFGTSGHRGTSLKRSFNEDHILATSQAICELRSARQINGPLFIGMDTHFAWQLLPVRADKSIAGYDQADAPQGELFVQFGQLHRRLAVFFTHAFPGG